MIGRADMIGGAIFVLVGPAVGLAVSAVIIAFIINGIIALFTAMGYAEPGSAMPEAGGGYLWLERDCRGLTLSLVDEWHGLPIWSQGVFMR